MKQHICYYRDYNRILKRQLTPIFPASKTLAPANSPLIRKSSSQIGQPAWNKWAEETDTIPCPLFNVHWISSSPDESTFFRGNFWQDTPERYIPSAKIKQFEEIVLVHLVISRRGVAAILPSRKMVSGKAEMAAKWKIEWTLNIKPAVHGPYDNILWLLFLFINTFFIYWRNKLIYKLLACLVFAEFSFQQLEFCSLVKWARCVIIDSLKT